MSLPLRVVAGIVMVALVVSGDPGSANAQDRDQRNHGVLTELGSQRLVGHAFIESAGNSGGSIGRDLLGECLDGYARRVNFLHVEDLVSRGVDRDVVLLNVPWPDFMPPSPAGTPSHCAGEAVVLAGAGMTCEPGQVPAYRLPYTYVPPATRSGSGEFEVAGRDDARRRSGDVGPWFGNPTLCVQLWDPGEFDAASFVESLPEVVIEKSPHVRGLVNLPTWVWYDFSDPASYRVTGAAQAGLHDLTITLESELWVDKVEWDLDGDGKADVVADAPDTELDPASHVQYLAIGGEDSESGGLGNFIYKKMGHYDITATVTWRGVYRVTRISGGGESLEYQGSRNVYDPVQVSASEQYDVISIRSQLMHRPNS